MIAVLIIAIVVYALYSQSGGNTTTTPATIDKVQPAPVVMDKVIAVESQPANKKPTAATQEVVTSTPSGVDSQFSVDQKEVVNTVVQKQKYIPGVVNPDGSYLDPKTGQIIYN